VDLIEFAFEDICHLLELVLQPRLQQVQLLLVALY
jgi:hypothetical protein